jgi:hypothetical protein
LAFGRAASLPDVVSDGDNGLALGDAIGVVDDAAVDGVAEGGFVLGRAVPFDEEDGAVDVFYRDDAFAQHFFLFGVARVEQHVVVVECNCGPR